MVAATLKALIPLCPNPRGAIYCDSPSASAKLWEQLSNNFIKCLYFFICVSICRPMGAVTLNPWLFWFGNDLGQKSSQLVKLKSDSPRFEHTDGKQKQMTKYMECWRNQCLCMQQRVIVLVNCLLLILGFSFSVFLSQCVATNWLTKNLSLDL